MGKRAVSISDVKCGWGKEIKVGSLKNSSKGITAMGYRGGWWGLGAWQGQTVAIGPSAGQGPNTEEGCEGRISSSRNACALSIDLN
jgi:hypothetical protein